jgi:hypothetical protein
MIAGCSKDESTTEPALNSNGSIEKSGNGNGNGNGNGDVVVEEYEITCD